MVPEGGSDACKWRIALAMDGSHDRAALERLACERTGAQPAIAAQRIEQLLGFLGRHGAIAG